MYFSALTPKQKRVVRLNASSADPRAVARQGFTACQLAIATTVCGTSNSKQCPSIDTANAAVFDNMCFG